MGIMFGGWAREDAEEELWYIKKYGLEVGQAMYQQYQKDQERARILVLTNPQSIRWSKSEPKVTRGDVIGKLVRKENGINEIQRESFVIDITEEGEILCKLITNDLTLDLTQGKSYIWEGEYHKISHRYNEKETNNKETTN